MLHISEILLKHHEVTTFEEFVQTLKTVRKTERFLRLDLKPPYPDTPDNWEAVVESVFYGYDANGD